ncbi:phosphotransferase enzyme family protein [Parafilimonas sp.]|uniref:phosphotransferase enzyme family protein n=1 Tax=Parafilimonas sp. TaxID=1969739 RepID=UPI0039E50279
MTNDIPNAYGLNAVASITPFGDGLINNTWKIEDAEKGIFILQRINTGVFKRPEYISDNIKAVSHYLSVHCPEYFFCTPVTTTMLDDLVYTADGCYRMYPFIKNSHTINVAENAGQAFEAARKFGELTRLLAGFPVYKLKITLPDFHNIYLRYNDFQKAVAKGNKERIQQSLPLIHFLNSQQHIVAEYEQLKTANALKPRVTHHDTKINNVLFDDNNKGICVIDLDTLMPGYFISDVGDMIRTYISPYGEEEKDFSKLEMREDYFAAIAEGYLHEMGKELNETELSHFVFAGKFLIYMQALRFLTDYLNNDVYYGSKYEGHNFLRAGNQAHLLQLLIEKEEKFQEIVNHIASVKSRHLSLPE